MDNDLNYEQDMMIDHTALDVEWLDQASLALKYGRHVIDLRHQLQMAEEEVKTVRSELVDSVNRNPKSTTGKEKPTATDIEAYYRKHPDYKEAVKEKLDLEAEVNMAEIAKNEIVYTRKQALENLVILHGQQYFAGPSVPRDLNKEWRKRHEDEEKANDGVSQRMKRRRRSAK